MTQKYYYPQEKVSKQIKAVKNQTDNPAVINDVIDKEEGAYPESYEDSRDEDALGEFEEYIVKNTTDGKTWNKIKNEDRRI